MESSGRQLILIVDRNNVLGSELSARLAESSTVVVVGEIPHNIPTIISIPLGKIVPIIPDWAYSHILFVFTKEDAHFVKPLFEKAEKHHGKLFLVATKETLSDVKIEREKLDKQVCLLVVGDLFGQEKNTSLTTFLATAKKTKKVQLFGVGLDLWYPVLIRDCVKEISQILFSPKKEKEVFIGPQHGITALSLSHALQKIDPEISIDFSKDQQLQTRHNEMPKAIGEYASLEKVQQFYKALIVSNKKQAKEIATVVFSNMPQNHKQNWFIPIIYCVLTLFLLPFIMFFGFALLGRLFLESSITDIKTQEWRSAWQKASAASTALVVSQQSQTICQFELQFVGQKDLLSTYADQVVLGEKLSEITQEGLTMGLSLQNIMSGKSKNPSQDANQVVSSEKRITLSLQAISISQIPKKYQPLFSSSKNLLSLFSGVIDEFPEIIGIGGEKKYLILFQNNMELRPGGGFIGSYGIVDFKNGKLQNFTVHDVYDADGQLKGHIEPPFAIRRYIPIVHLYLRDSNFDVDFVSNAQKTAYMLYQETGERVNGVAGVDLTAVKGLIASLGSVYVPSFNTIVTKDNFFLLTEEHSEKNFFAGSSQKKDFLQSLLSALLDTLQTKHTILPDQLLQNIYVAFVSKDILVGFADPILQQPFTSSNLSSSIVNLTASTSADIKDFLGINEANIGVDKVNAFVTRDVSQQIAINDKGSIQDTVSLHLENTSDGSWPGGVYKDYIRFILPSGTTLSGISFNNQSQKLVDAITDPLVYEAKSFKAPLGLEVENTTENGRQLFGFLVTIQPKSSLTITISYNLTQKVNTAYALQTYALNVFKQPGIDSFPYTLSLWLPNSMSLVKNNQFVQNEQTYIYSTSINADQNVLFRLSNQ